MLQKRSFTFLLFFVFFIGYQLNAENKIFDGYDLIFEYPDSWTITETTELDGIYYISVEQKGEDKSGIFQLTISDDSLDLLSFQESAMLDLRANFKSVGIVRFDLRKPMKFGAYETLFLPYTAEVSDAKFQGFIYTFHTRGRTVNILMQSSDDDLPECEPAYEMIETTLKIEE